MAQPTWQFTAAELTDSPSRRDGVSADTEARYRRDGAGLIRGLGQALEL